VLIDGPLLSRPEETARVMATIWEALTNENIPWAQRPGTALTIAHASLQREEAGDAGRASAAVVLIRSNSLSLAHTGNIRMLRLLDGAGIAPLNRPFPVPWATSPAEREEGEDETSSFLGGSGELRLAAPRHPVSVQPQDQILLLSGAAAGSSEPWTSDEARALSPEELATCCVNATAEDVETASTIVLRVPPAGLTKAPEEAGNRFQRAKSGPTTRVGSTLPGSTSRPTSVPTERPRLWLAAGGGLALAALLFFTMDAWHQSAPPPSPPKPMSVEKRPAKPHRPQIPPSRPAQHMPGNAAQEPSDDNTNAPLTAELPRPRAQQRIGDRLSRGLLRSPRNVLDVLRGQFRQRLIAAETPRQPRARPPLHPDSISRALAQPEKTLSKDSPEWRAAITLRATRIVDLLTQFVIDENLKGLRGLETRLTSERGTPTHRATFKAILSLTPEPIVTDWALIHMGKLR